MIKKRRRCFRRIKAAALPEQAIKPTFQTSDRKNAVASSSIVWSPDKITPTNKPYQAGQAGLCNSLIGDLHVTLIKRNRLSARRRYIFDKEKLPVAPNASSTQGLTGRTRKSQSHPKPVEPMPQSKQRRIAQIRKWPPYASSIFSLVGYCLNEIARSKPGSADQTRANPADI